MAGTSPAGAQCAISSVATNSNQPELDFVLNPVDYLKAMQTGEIEAVVHSHPKSGGPSAFDRKSCRQTKLRWYVFTVPDSTWEIIEP